MDNTMLAAVAKICGLSPDEQEILRATYDYAYQEKPEELQSISDKLQKAMLEFTLGTHKQHVRQIRRMRMEGYDMQCETTIYNVTYTLFRSKIGSNDDKPYLAAEWAEETHKGGYRNLFYGQYPDVLMNYYERINHRLETMANLHSMAKDPGRVLYARDCIDDSRDNDDYTGQVVLLLQVMLCDGYEDADMQLFYVQGGPGCVPGTQYLFTNKAWFEGVLLLSGERWVSHRQLTYGIIKPELLPAWAAEKVKEIEAATLT